MRAVAAGRWWVWRLLHRWVGREMGDRGLGCPAQSQAPSPAPPRDAHKVQDVPKHLLRCFGTWVLSTTSRCAPSEPPAQTPSICIQSTGKAKGGETTTHEACPLAPPPTVSQGFRGSSSSSSPDMISDTCSGGIFKPATGHLLTLSLQQ